MLRLTARQTAGSERCGIVTFSAPGFGDTSEAAYELVLIDQRGDHNAR
jgi:hypothetical protein